MKYSTSPDKGNCFDPLALATATATVYLELPPEHWEVPAGLVREFILSLLQQEEAKAGM
jgi:hypothetical protein